jgi:DNA-binding MarR family transcriptional regulator
MTAQPDDKLESAAKRMVRPTGQRSLGSSYYLALAALAEGKGEADEKRSADVPRRRAMARLQNIAAKIEQASAVTARQFGIHVTDLYVLVLLHGVGEGQTVRLADIQRALGFTAGGVSRRLDSMAAKGLAVRLPDPNDGRAWRAQITSAGAALAGEIFARSRNRTSRVPDLLSRTEWTELERMLTIIDGTLG